jgi:tetratricopeptide (TPR) repeat protein
MIGLCLICLMDRALAQGAVQVALKFVPRKEAREKVAPEPNQLGDIVRLRADADSSAGIARIVFEIDNQFRAEVKKPPYLYDWDTLAENDGTHTISVIAYNVNGQTGVQRVKVKVENKLALGHKHFAREALEAFRRADELGLVKAARKAYRITTVDPSVARMMALAVGVQGDLARAFQMLDDRQLGIPPEDPITLEVRGFLLLARAFRNPDIRASLADLQQGMALTRRRSQMALEETLKEFPASTTEQEGLLARGDAFFGVGKYDAALEPYQKAAEKAASGTPRRRAVQRVGATLLALGRTAEAEKSILKLIKDREANTTTYALLAGILFQQRKYQVAREMVENGVTQRNPASLVVSVLCNLALGARAEAYKQARDAVYAADTAETQYVALAALGDNGDKEGAFKSFTSAAINAPLYVPNLTERAFQVMNYDQDSERFAKAINLFDLVLTLDSNCAAAVAGRTLALMQEKRHSAAQTFLARWSKLEPTAPDLFVLTAVDLYRDPTKVRAMNEALARARQIDPANFRDQRVPELPEISTRIMRLRRTVPFTPRFLDRADAPPAPLDDVKTGQAAE